MALEGVLKRFLTDSDQSFGYPVYHYQLSLSRKALVSLPTGSWPLCLFIQPVHLEEELLASTPCVTKTCSLIWQTVMLQSRLRQGTTFCRLYSIVQIYLRAIINVLWVWLCFLHRRFFFPLCWHFYQQHFTFSSEFCPVLLSQTAGKVQLPSIFWIQMKILN